MAKKSLILGIVAGMIAAIPGAAQASATVAAQGTPTVQRTKDAALPPRPAGKGKLALLEMHGIPVDNADRKKHNTVSQKKKRLNWRREGRYNK